MSKKLFLTLAIFFVLIGSAQAGLLVDTGQPTATTGGMSVIYPQTLLAQFVLTQPATITAIQGWINVTQAGIMWVQIYQDNGDAPGGIVHTQSVTVNPTGASWVGASSLNWNLGAGTYWVGFWTGMASWPNPLGTMPGPTPAPLGKEGVISAPGAGFVLNPTMDIGIRIYSSSSSPAANTLLLND